MVAGNTATVVCDNGIWTLPQEQVNCTWWLQGAYVVPVGLPVFYHTGEEVLSQLAPQHKPSQQEEAPVPPADPVAPVVLSNLPHALCTGRCLEAMLDQAGLENAIISYEVRAGKKRGRAVISLNSERAADRCIAHFQGLRWGHGSGRPVNAFRRTREDAANAQSTKQQSKKGNGDAPAGRERSLGEEQHSSQQRLELPLPERRHEDLSKPRWADLESDDEDDFTASTSAGEGPRSTTSLSDLSERM